MNTPVVAGSLRDRCAPGLENSGLERSGENALSLTTYCVLHRIESLASQNSPTAPACGYWHWPYFLDWLVEAKRGKYSLGPCPPQVLSPWPGLSLFPLLLVPPLGVSGEGQVPRLTPLVENVFHGNPVQKPWTGGRRSSSASWTPKQLLTSGRCPPSLRSSFFTG